MLFMGARKTYSTHIFLSGQSWVYVSVLPSGVGKRKLCETVLFSQTE